MQINCILSAHVHAPTSPTGPLGRRICWCFNTSVLRQNRWDTCVIELFQVASRLRVALLPARRKALLAELGPDDREVRIGPNKGVDARVSMYAVDDNECQVGVS